jgi:hypothetical protein
VRIGITPFLHAGYEVKARPILLLNCKPALAELWTGLLTTAACDRKQCKIVAARDADGIAHAMVVFLVYYYHSSRKKNLAHVGAVSPLLWTGIELARSRGLWFDYSSPGAQTLCCARPPARAADRLAI